MPPRRPLEERFAEKVDKESSDTWFGGERCHHWTGYLMKSGYGQMTDVGQTLYVHRVCWELNKGPIPEGLSVLHHCDNRRCVNPNHLFLGTLDDNMADMTAKDRQARGERSIHAKLTDAQALEIRNSPKKQSELAEEYGLTQSTISALQNGHTWKHLREDIVCSEPKGSAAS